MPAKDFLDLEEKKTYKKLLKKKKEQRLGKVF